MSGKGKPTWSGSVAVDKAKAINHVSCASASVCVAVDHAGKFMIYNGTSWSAPAYIQPKARLVMQGISCPSSTFCMAVGNAGDAYVFNGTSWSGDVGIPKGHTLESVSCLSSTFCVAVGADGQAYSYSGSSLSLMGDPDGKAKIVSVSCPSMTFCVAVGAQGGVLTYSLGSGWSAPVRVDSTHTLNSVSCSSPSFCVAVDANGNGVVYSHAGPYAASQWHVSNVDGARALESVTCIDPSFCKAVDADGNVLSLTFGSWSAATDIDGAHALESISCPSESRCAAVDNNGGALLDQVASQATDDTWDRTGSLPQLLSDGTDDYIYGPSGEPVEQINVTSTPPTSNPQYLTYTATDETWLITNAAGQQLSYYGFDAYGNLAFGVQGSPFGYAGQYEDGPTQSGGLYDMRARWYDSQTGNFTSWDPAFSQTHQAYSYANGDPVNGNDPSGMQCGPVLKTVAPLPCSVLGSSSSLPPSVVAEARSRDAAVESEIQQESSVGLALAFLVNEWKTIIAPQVEQVYGAASWFNGIPAVGGIASGAYSGGELASFYYEINPPIVDVVYLFTHGIGANPQTYDLGPTSEGLMSIEGRDTPIWGWFQSLEFESAAGPSLEALRDVYIDELKDHVHLTDVIRPDPNGGQCG